MRKIRFRVWLKYEERMETVGTIDFINKYVLCQEDGINGECRYFQDLVLMQYTGLKDKNGVEIYEGDIIKISCNGMNENIFVKWDYEVAGFKGYIRKKPDTPKWMLCGSENCMEVISNIYENPEIRDK